MTHSRSGRPAIPAEEFEHGDARRYWRGCHCRPCTTAVNRKTRWNAYLRHTGRGTYRSPQRAAAHINALRAAGMQDRDILNATGVVPDVIYRIMRAAGDITAATEQRILTIPIPTAQGPTDSRARVPATGTVRRLRALIASGWYLSELARRLGQNHKQYVECLVNGRGGATVTLHLAQRVEHVYQHLAAERPEDHGLPPAHTARARQSAARKGWADTTFWEDWGGIDDPAAPETEPKAKHGPHAEARHRAAEIRHLATFGLSHEEIAERLSTPEKTIRPQYVGGVLTGRGPGWRQQQREVAA